MAHIGRKKKLKDERTEAWSSNSIWAEKDQAPGPGSWPHDFDTLNLVSEEAECLRGGVGPARDLWAAPGRQQALAGLCGFCGVLTGPQRFRDSPEVSGTWFQWIWGTVASDRLGSAERVREGVSPRPGLVVSRDRTNLGSTARSSKRRQLAGVAWGVFTLTIISSEPTHWERPWCWERLRAGGKGGDRGWDGWMA